MENDLHKKIDFELTSLNGKTIGYIANSLGYTSPKFLVLLSKKGYSQKESDVLSQEQLQKLKPMLFNYLKNKYTFKLKDQQNNKQDKKNYKTRKNSVYDELKSFGLGKLIYIRSK